MRWVFGALLVVPVLEIAVIVAVGRTIGGWPTLGLLIVESLIGAWLVKREGSRAFGALSEALRSGRMPSRQLADAALVLVGGALLLTPGFATDAVGFLFILPVTRPWARRWLEVVVARRLLGPTDRWPGPQRTTTTPGEGPDVVSGEVVD
ncbi:MAG: FxsA family protein [Dermatophilaceae bacterium]